MISVLINLTMKTINSGVILMILLSGGLNTFSQLPYLDKSENSIKLIADGEPYIMLGGELHNSTSSSVQYMQNVWADMATINLNTVIATVSWELSNQSRINLTFRLSMR